jgi:imidazolonepropionase-like amidohydrolase
VITLIRADRLIDGTGAAPVANPVLVIEGDKVVSVHEGAVPEGLIRGEAATIDLPGCTILPGLIDTHVHLNLPGDGALLEEAMREPEGVLIATSTFAVGKALAAGITTVRDVGALGATAINVRRALQLGHGEGARVIACGQPITITGGHTWYFGGEADGEDGLRRKVREMVKLGAEFIKVMASGGGTIGTQSWNTSYTPRELAVLVEEAHRHDRKITAHCLCAQSILDVIEAGFDQIEHAGFITDGKGSQSYDPAVAERLAKSGIPVTSTLAVGGAIMREMASKKAFTPAEEAFFARWKTTHATNLDQFRKLRAAGVTFVAGTDSGWRFTRIDDQPMEIALMHEGGMSPMEAIVASTGLAAKVIGIEDKLGTLTPGLTADVLVVKGDPLDDLGALRNVRLVMQGGKRKGGALH